MMGVVVTMPLDFTDDQSEAFARILDEARKKTGLKQKEVAQRTGVSATTLSTLERAAFPGMRFVDLARLADFYGLDLNDIARALGLMK